MPPATSTPTSSRPSTAPPPSASSRSTSSSPTLRGAWPPRPGRGWVTSRCPTSPRASAPSTRASTIAESGLRSGAHVAVTRRTEGYADRGQSVATAVVVAGPDTGREVPLGAGTAYLGRGRGCEIQLSDAQVSRRHARLLVTDILEVIDLGSSNGIQVQGQQVDRAVLKSGDRFKIGETEVEVRVAGWQHRARRGPRHVAAVLAVAADRAALRRARVPAAGTARAAQARAAPVDRGGGADAHGRRARPSRSTTRSSCSSSC